MSIAASRRGGATQRQHSTPFGLVTTRSAFSGAVGVDLVAYSTEGRLLSTEGQVLGLCHFGAYYVKPAHGPLNAAQIALAAQGASIESADLVKTVATWDAQRLEKHVNRSCLLVAEHIEMFCPARGSGAWKALYMASLEATLQSHRNRPPEFYFKVQPIGSDGMGLTVLDLKRLYAVHLSARTLVHDSDAECYMVASVPTQSAAVR
jgi:hypothetical protein